MNWLCCYKVNFEKFVFGDVNKVVEVVCDLWCCDQECGLLVGEKCMLVKVWQILVGELVLVESIDDVKVEIIFDEVLVVVF